MSECISTFFTFVGFLTSLLFVTAVVYKTIEWLYDINCTMKKSDFLVLRISALEKKVFPRGYKL